MKSERVMWISVTIVVVAIAFGVGAGLPEPAPLVLGVVLLGLVAAVGAALSRWSGSSWMFPTIVAAFLVKLGGAGARLWVLQSLYQNVGDATGYHNRGLALAEVWRTASVPALTQAGGGSTGTKMISIIAGLLYAPYKPTILGGFFIFATVAFFGQLLLLSAYRRSNLPRPNVFAIAVLFLPSLVFWPSSVGKDSVMLFFIGLAAYGSARLLDSYRFAPVLPIGLGLAGAALIRPHVAALLVAGLVVALLIGKAPDVPGAQTRRLVMLAVAGVGLVALAVLAFRTLGVAPSAQEIDPFLNELQRRTTQGGSAATGSAVRSIAQIPAGMVRVLFRPFPNEAHNAQAFLSSIEGTLFLALVLWRLPRMIANLRVIRARPYLLFSLVYTAVFSVAFSAIFNLGILARERIQVIPFVLALLVGMGWNNTEEMADSPEQGSEAIAA